MYLVLSFISKPLNSVSLYKSTISQITILQITILQITISQITISFRFANYPKPYTANSAGTVTGQAC